jgi:hypothetical protein
MLHPLNNNATNTTMLHCLCKADKHTPAQLSFPKQHLAQSKATPSCWAVRRQARHLWPAGSSMMLLTPIAESQTCALRHTMRRLRERCGMPRHCNGQAHATKKCVSSVSNTQAPQYQLPRGQAGRQCVQTPTDFATESITGPSAVSGKVSDPYSTY